MTKQKQTMTKAHQDLRGWGQLPIKELFELGYNGSLFVQTVHVDTLSGATTVLYTFTIDRGVSFEVSYILKPLFCFSLEISSTYMNLVIFQFDSALVLRLHLLTTALLFIFSIANVS